jgi:meckelin
VLLFCLSVVLGGKELYNATQQPTLEDKSPGDINMILNFANTTFYFLLFSYGQWAWKFFIYERYLGEPPERLFVDFCTIAKISVIVLDEKYHGYYLHCRSPHQYADGTMTELVSMLHKEEAGLTVDRSLDGAPADVQTFEIYMSGEWREAFDKIRVTLVGAESVAEVMNDNRNRALSRAAKRGGVAGAIRGGVGRNSRAGGGAGAGTPSSNNNIPSDRVLKAWKEMLTFLQEFVENNFGKACLRRIVREPTYWEKLSKASPELSIPDQPSVFYTDREFNYCKVWFLGRELELLTLNILAFSIFDVWFNSTATSILLTYLLELGICYFRHSFGQVCTHFVLYYPTLA